MVKVCVMYGHPENEEAFEKYYFEEHLKLAAKIKNTQKVEITKFVSDAQGQKPTYYRMAELYFEDMKELELQMSTPEGREAVADIPNFATGGHDVMIAKV